MSYSHRFTTASEAIAFDQRHRDTIKFNISKYDAAVQKGMARYADVELAKKQAAAIKRDVLTHWDQYLLEFESNITKNGAKVLWAADTAEATLQIEKIIKEREAKLVVKSKSMTTEEIEFNHIAETLGCESIETDLGEFIVQVAGERPYHIVTPAMHKSKDDIAQLFNKKFGTPRNSTPEEMTEYVRELLREKYIRADIGVTGANFLIADIGAISVTENEGNAIMSTAFPKLHLVIAGIEKIIPKMSQLGLFYPLLAAHGTGQQMTAYNSIFTGPKTTDEIDGPEEMIVILIDNGRTNLYADTEVAEALACIRCGACLNACPVYKTIGGYTYDATYSGPIGSVITPFLKGFKDFSHLSFASTLCGKCVDVCPVKIPLTDILLANRRKAVESGLRPQYEKLLMQGFTIASSSRNRMNMIPSELKNTIAAPFNYIGWGPKRTMPKFAKKSFAQRYQTKK